jgi:hypothetical protein
MCRGRYLPLPGSTAGAKAVRTGLGDAGCAACASLRELGVMHGCHEHRPPADEQAFLTAVEADPDLDWIDETEERAA